MSKTNIFDGLPEERADEDFATLVETGQLKLERIVSNGQSTPAGEWYDQDRDEWVLLLRGRAGLRFEDEAFDRTLEQGDCLNITAHRRHRVTWTDQNQPTVWLALHYQP